MAQVNAFVKAHAKALTAFVVTVAGGAVAQGLVTGQAALWVLLVVGAITGVTVHAVPNKPPA